MMVGAQVGDGPHLGILVLLLGLAVLGHIIDTIVIRLAPGIHHWGLVLLAGVTVLLHVAFLFAVAAHDVGFLGPLERPC